LSLISVEAITKSYFGKIILDNISLCINPGDRVGFIGENGAGKTTLFKIMSGKEVPDSGRVVLSGNTVIGYLTQEAENPNESETNALSSMELKNLEKMISDKEHEISRFADNHDSPEYKILENEYNFLISKFESMDGYAYERNMKEILSGLNLPEDALTLPFSALSGGEKMRISLARILLKKPDLLLLDEPTNHLDIHAVEWLEETLSKYKGGLIVISHDRYFLDKITNKTASIENKRIILRNGNYSSFSKQRIDEMDFAQKERERLEKEIARQSQVKQTLLSHRNMSGYHEREKIISKLSDSLNFAKSNSRSMQKSKLKLSINNSGAIKNSKKVILKAKNIQKAFGDRVLFSDVSFEISSKDKIFLVGPNGCGKSTLFSLFLGQTDDFEGEIEISDKLTFAHMTQHVSFEDESFTLLEELITCHNLSFGQAMSTLARFGFYDTDVHKQINVLSGGERSRLFLACSLLENPDILFLDEPTNHLDIPSREVLENALNNYQGAFFAISHDRYFINNCGNKIFGFSDKSIGEFDSYNNYKSTSFISDFNIPEKKQSGNKEMSERKNRAEERKFTALKKKRIAFLEDEIKSLEEKRDNLEASFGPETSLDDYELFATLVSEIEKSYEEYFEMEQ